MSDQLTDFTETPSISKGSMKDLDLASIGMYRIDYPGMVSEGIYELWGKDGVFVYRNVRGYYSLIGRPSPLRRYYFDDEDNILNTVIKTE